MPCCSDSVYKLENDYGSKIRANNNDNEIKLPEIYVKETLEKYERMKRIRICYKGKNT